MLIKLLQLKTKYKGFDISFGFSTFVPKANTPFQWFGREDEKSFFEFPGDSKSGVYHIEFTDG